MGDGEEEKVESLATFRQAALVCHHANKIILKTSRAVGHLTNLPFQGS